MPNLLAHNLLVKKLYDEVSIDEDFKDSFLYRHYKQLQVGAQGPDPLFFTGLVPSRGLHLILALKKFGNKIHHDDGRKFFKVMFDEYYNINEEVPKKSFASFILGQLAHYLLDTTTHPYIYYESGFDENGKVTKSYHYKHAFFETNIDLALAEKFSYLTFREKPTDFMVTDKGVLREINPLINGVLCTYFNIKKVPNHLYESAYFNMIHFWKSMNGPLGKIKSKMVGKNISLSAMNFPDQIDYSVLNDDRDSWQDPETGEEFHYSFLDLFDMAYKKLLSAYYSLIKNGRNFTSIADFFDKDYSGVSKGGVKKFKKEN